jgi:hypothetical protein
VTSKTHLRAGKRAPARYKAVCDQGYDYPSTIALRDSKAEVTCKSCLELAETGVPEYQKVALFLLEDGVWCFSRFVWDEQEFENAVAEVLRLPGVTNFRSMTFVDTRESPR